MSVDTNVKGKNLSPYRKLRHDDFKILITPKLLGMAESMRIVTKGKLSKSLRVEFRAHTGDSDTGAAGAGDDNCCI